jgi:RHS repeat-associated protein
MAYTYTRVDPQRYPPSGSAGKRVKSRDAHPVAQLKPQDNPVLKPLQATHRPLPPRTHSFHTIYDASGNTTYDAALRKFTYDAENKQVKVESTNTSQIVTGTVGEYSYDGDGKRVKKYVPSSGETTIFVYDAAGKQIAEYSTVVAPTSEAKVSYLTNDHLGSPRINTDANGAVTARHDYHPFGEEITRANYGTDTIRQKFTAYERDNETDLDFGQARYYSSRLGRFYSVDPENAGASADNPQTWNAFAYVGNNPVNITDSTGLSWYFRSELNKYKWYEDNEEVGKSYVRVVGNNGQRGSFSYEAEGGTFVTLDPYSNNYQTRIATKEDAIKLADRLYQYSPEKREFVAGYNKNYDRNMTILTVAMLADIAIIALPIAADAAIAALAAETTTAAAATATQASSVVGRAITGFTKHGINQAISREGFGVSTRAILNTLKNPTKVIQQADGTVKILGKDAGIVLNQAGKVITAWARNSASRRITP